WVDICRNGRFLEPISNGFRTGLLGGDAPDYASSLIIRLFFLEFGFIPNFSKNVFISNSL
ncbi:hypothetical protein, partial [Dysgonomonas sp. 521]|uniref:hypothetical protein n=1 Tax=Dysgonomonas sp. 521 TaxID=2302932 RepID=UPI001C87467C